MSQVVAEDLDIGKAIHRLADACIMMMLTIRVGRDRIRRPESMIDPETNQTIYRFPSSTAQRSHVRVFRNSQCAGCMVAWWRMASRYGKMQVRFPNPCQCVSKTESAPDSPFQTILIPVPLLFPSCYSAALTLIDQSEITAGVSTCCEDCCTLDDTLPTDAGCVQREALSSFVFPCLIISLL